MAIPPEQVAPDECYRTEDGELRLVWLVRDEKVHYFHRPETVRHWTPPDCYRDPPTVEVFAAEVAPCRPPAEEEAKRQVDGFFDGDW
jgi:hypothetical protein